MYDNGTGGICRKCREKISPVAQICPHCTHDYANEEVPEVIRQAVAGYVIDRGRATALPQEDRPEDIADKAWARRERRRIQKQDRNRRAKEKRGERANDSHQSAVDQHQMSGQDILKYFIRAGLCYIGLCVFLAFALVLLPWRPGDWVFGGLLPVALWLSHRLKEFES
jgi:hypothetical protein